MQSQSGPDEGGDRTSLSSDKSANSLLQDPQSHYTDKNADLRYDVRDSGDLELDDDLELGDIPLLPSHLRGSAPALSRSRTIRHEPRFSCSLSGLHTWLRGPSPPHTHHIQPWFPRYQAAPARFVDRWFPWQNAKIALLLGGLIFWMLVFFSALKASVADKNILGYGQPVKLSCHHRLWGNATDCGLNGDSCRPFEDQSFAFRCPPGCSAAMLLEPYGVGDQDVNYRPLVIGGKPLRRDGVLSGIYRGDSSICAAALHAGMTSDSQGGCAILHRKGERDDYPSFEQNGIESIPFPSHFPMSFLLTREASSSGSSQAKPVECSDIRWPLFAFTVLMTTIMSLTITSPPAFYSAIFFVVWFQVAMASDPPASGFYDLVSIGLGRFLPGAFVGFVLYYFCAWETLHNLDAHIDKTVLWLGGCWVGALNTDTFDRIPISRLTLHDIQQQPGAVTALLIIVGSLVVIVVSQALAFRREGRFFSKLGVYGLLILTILILVAVPHMNLRIHHYILSLLFLPGTTLQTRPSLLYQGILIGLFINGIARWGFDSILQTPAALLDGARLGTTPPKIDVPILPDTEHLTFKFPELEPHIEGLSVLVNDVQRYKQFRPKEGGALPDFNWTRLHPGKPEYFRFGYIHEKKLGGVWYEDFSKPSSWLPDGNYFYPN
ncbi:hypothetical protein NUU61_002270 [Penicillium alfredii]|uniref:LCCL domain-containing protein n=1 Tax=Penicillium alfredii TaxID=1506179 RepID=A0A9W9KGQ4_9EURO|nr:uncharacterized protein NUU61_002270 [Penicillium alfredii]KAJ5104923.1 hypothetical protein NUU61_002270 [Penicillium alfredii]